jgi:DNA topoisomerase-2
VISEQKLCNCNRKLTCMLQKGKAKAAAPKKTAASKPKSSAPKKMVQSTLKTKPLTKKRPKPDTDDEEGPSDVDSFGGDGSGLSNTPPSSKKQKKVPAKKTGMSKPLGDIENDSILDDVPSVKKVSAKKKTATDQYQKLTQLEHIIKRPDTYIGSVEHTTEQLWGEWHCDA